VLARGSATCTVGVMTWAALIPIIVLAFVFVVYCLVDIARSQVSWLPKWAWAVVVVVSIPLGGIVYLLVGRQRS
jgi:ACR3 family arsenite efflux pump ArsB